MQFVLYLSPPLLRKSLRFISRAMAASVHPMMMVCTPTPLGIYLRLCRGGFSQPHSNPRVRNTPPLLRFVTHEGREGWTLETTSFGSLLVCRGGKKGGRTDGSCYCFFAGCLAGCVSGVRSRKNEGRCTAPLLDLGLRGLLYLRSLRYLSQ